MTGILLIVGCLFVGQTESTPADHGTEVRRLVRQLDAPQLDARNAAEAKLIELGPETLPLLPSPDSQQSAEVRQRLGRVRRALEQKLAAAAVEPSRVTLHEKQAKLSRVLKEIERQTGNRIIDSREQFGRASDPEVAVDFNKTPFWRAMDRVLDEAGLTVYPFGSERAVYLADCPEGAVPMTRACCQTGPFLFVPVELTAKRLVNAANEGTLHLGMVVAWEPRLAPIGLTQRLTEIQAIDENGAALDVDVRLGALEVPVNPTATAVKLSIPFAVPPRDVQKIVRLTGTLDALVPGPIETFRFTGLPAAKDVSRRVANATVTLQGMRKNDDIWEIEVRVRFEEAGDALASHRGWIFSNEAYLEGPDGKRVENEGFETKMQTENEVGVAYLFYLEDSPAKYTFVYKTPARIFTTRFKYEFQDLELP
ncbi:MAG TPA: hypothetical protein VJL29_09315 [Thermoguttaceae bacterium]|nr:hypothetical protein [Thermoguttaceae bacterium]